jgi:hypothetical protein
MARIVLAPLAILLLTGCTPTEPAAEALQDGMARWEARGPSNYDMVVQRGHCECLPEMVVPVRVSVRDNSIESVRNEQTCEAIGSHPFNALSVEGIFSLIQSALAQNAHRVTVRYDAVLGYPRTVVIDYDSAAADDEVVLTAEIAP